MKTFEKDPVDVLDYEWNWENWIGTDTIESVTVSIENGPGTITDVSFTLNKVTVWISGGAVNQSSVVSCKITTTQGRTKKESANFIFKDK